MHDRVEIIEVAPRDGLQGERDILPTAAKLELIGRLLEAGCRRIEVTAFVHPERVPQMADAESVAAGLPEVDDVCYIGLVLNMRGYERALATRDRGRGIDEIGCVCVASDSFARRNQGQSCEESVRVACEILDYAARDGLRAQATISAAFGCPFEGEVPPGRVVEMARRLAGAGPHEIVLADTIGAAVPAQVGELFAALAAALPGMPLRAHFHNTRNTGIANAWAAYQAGVRRLDASLGGLGGCPFAPAATGNIATEDLVYMLDRSSIDHGLDLAALIALNKDFSDLMGRPLPAMVSRAGGFPAVRRGDNTGTAG